MATNYDNSTFFDSESRLQAAQERQFDPNVGELDPATISYYRERARIRTELVLADWRTSVTAYLLVVFLAFLWQ